MYLQATEMFERIQELCSAKGVTIKQAERELGWANGSLRKTDPTKTSFARIIQLADYLGTSTDSLLDGSGAPQEVNSNVPVLAPDETELIKAWREADAEEKRMIIEMLAYFKSKKAAD